MRLRKEERAVEARQSGGAYVVDILSDETCVVLLSVKAFFVLGLA